MYLVPFGKTGHEHDSIIQIWPGEEILWRLTGRYLQSWNSGVSGGEEEEVWIVVIHLLDVTSCKSAMLILLDTNNLNKYR